MGSDPISFATQIVAASLVLVLPGYIWLSWFPPKTAGLLTRLAEMIGLSLALNALAGLALFLLGLQVSSESVVVVYAALGILGAISLAIEMRHKLFRLRILIRHWRSGMDAGLQPEAEPEPPGQTPVSWPGRSPAVFALAGLAALVGIVIWRFVQVRDLVLPAWVDSLHHVLIVKLILENGGIPASFAPYMPVPFYYHFGFHASAALFALLAGLSPDAAVLTLGQVINAGVSLSVFWLAMELWDDWRRATLPLTLWTLALLALSSPWGPRLYPFRPDHALIVLFLPAALLVANALFAAADRLRGRGLQPAGLVLVGVVLAGFLAWGLRDTRQILNPVTIIADAADRQALRWIEANTPADARFYINVTPWQSGIYRGVDGGWWILPLTGRGTLVPPSMYILGEPSFLQQVNDWAGRATQLTTCTPELQELLQDARLNYIYARADRGNLVPAALAGCPYLEPVYARDGVEIFHVR